MAIFVLTTRRDFDEVDSETLGASCAWFADELYLFQDLKKRFSLHLKPLIKFIRVFYVRSSTDREQNGWPIRCRRYSFIPKLSFPK